MAKLTGHIIAIIVSIVIGLSLGAQINWMPKPEWKKTYAEKFVFSVYPIFLNYEAITIDLEMIDYDLYKKNLDKNTIAIKKKERMNLRKKLGKASKKLDKKLLEIIKVYGDDFKDPVNDFMRWREQNPFVSWPLKKNRDWSDGFNAHEKKIYQKLRQVTGIYNIDNSQEAYVMHILPEAVKELKKNPNDPKFCLVMSDFKDEIIYYLDPKKIAQRIAFIDYGQEYCSNYYNKKSSWGMLGKSNGIKWKSEIDKLPYSKYYKKEVLPRIAEASAKIREENKDAASQNSRYCDILHFRGLLPRRDPERDAMRAAAKQKAPEICKLPRTADIKNYNDTSYSCITGAMSFCVGPNYCDAVEVCKPFAGSLFKD